MTSGGEQISAAQPPAEQPGGTGVAPTLPGDAAHLLERVRNGDREAAAELVLKYEPVIRRRIRGRLGSDMRRLVDSLDIVSTVARRLDRCVHEGRVQASSDAQVWSLLKQITDNAFKEKGRAFQRMRRFERGLASEGTASEAPEGTSDPEQVRAAIGLLADPADLELARLRLAGTDYSNISRLMGISVEAARQRWSSLRRRISGALRSTRGN